MKRMLCIWLPRWPLQRLFLAQPELKLRAVTLYEQNRGLKVVLSNQRGITPGMPLAEATAQGALQLELHSPAQDRAALAMLAQACEEFSPVVGLEESNRPECLYLDITGLAALFGGEHDGEENLGRQVAQALAQRGLFARIALADTLGAAWAVSHFAAVDDDAERRDGCTIVRPGETGGALAPLPLAALRLPAAMVAMLHELGIETVGQLCVLPRASLAARFDRQLLVRMHQALGEVAEAIEAHRAPPEIVLERDLEYPLERRDAVETIVGQLIRQACECLTARQYGVVQLECSYTCQARPVRAVVGLFQPSATASHLMDLVHTRMERLALPGAVSAIRIAVLLSAPLEVRQKDLFGEDRSHDEHFAPLVNRLSSRLGLTAVTRPLLVADAQPEFAVRHDPLAGHIREKAARPARVKKVSGYREGRTRSARQPMLHQPDTAASQSTPPTKTRPLFLEPRPLPLEVSSVVPLGPPVSLQWRNQHHRVAASWGPERIQTGWWRGHYIRRDYYRIETAAGHRFWIFRRHDGRWFLHGIFG